MTVGQKMKPMKDDPARSRASHFKGTVTALFALALIALATRSAQAFPPPTTCIDSASGPGITPSTVVSGDVIVPSGQGCTLTDVVVVGDVNLAAGASYFISNGAHIGGDIHDRGALTVTLSALQSAVAPSTGTTCPNGYSYDSTSGFCLFNNASAASSSTTIGGDFVANGGGNVLLNGVEVTGNFLASGLNSITTSVPPLACPTGSVVILQEAFVVSNQTSAFAIQQLVCTDGEVEISLNTDGYQSYLPGAPFGVGGNLLVSGTQGTPAPPLLPPNLSGSCPTGFVLSGGECVGPATNEICNATVGGNFELVANGSSAPFTIGNPPSSVFLGNSLPTVLPCLSNTVNGNTLFVGNQSAVMGQGNVILGKLACLNNNPAPMGSNNRVGGPRIGQCANGQF